MRPRTTARRRIGAQSAPISYGANRATVADIALHLRRCDAHFIPPLSDRVDIDAYAAKIAAHAERFEAWEGDGLMGLIAAYFNDPARRTVFVTSVSVVPERGGAGIASTLLRDCVGRARRAGFAQIRLQVRRSHAHAIRLYEKCGFSRLPTEEPDLTMNLDLTEVPERHARL